MLTLAEFPLSGFRSESDDAVDYNTWKRSFQSIATSPASPFYVSITITVLPPSADIRSQFARSTCESTGTGSGPAPMQRLELSAPQLGDRSRACYLLYEFETFGGPHVSSRVIDYLFTTRNAQVRIEFGALSTADQAAVLSDTIDVARRQLAKIETAPAGTTAVISPPPSRSWVPPSPPPGKYVVSGTVTDEGGRPIEDVAVTRLCRTVGDPACPPSVTTTTDANGHYALFTSPGTFALLFVDARSLRGAGPARYHAHAWNSPPDATASNAATLTVPPSRNGIDATLRRR